MVLPQTKYVYSCRSSSHQPADNVIVFVEDGSRMQPPDDCPDSVFDVMLKCWELNPTKRPTFSSIQRRLEDLKRQLLTDTKKMETDF